MNQRAIQVALQSSMQEKGWQLRAVCGLSPAYARDALVTPYFYCSQVRRTARGNYAIEGVVGVIHKKFEELWIEREAGLAGGRGFAMSLHIANLREISERSWIEADSNAEAVNPFCSAVANALEQFPSTEQDLIKAFRENSLYGLRVDQFAGFAHRAKFYALKEFVASLNT